jgi:hypothetical protein
VSAPIPGDPVYLGSFLVNSHWYGVVGDGDTPAMQVATMEAVGQDAVICLDALKGEQGEDGKPADIVQMQWDLLVTEPSDLPTDLNNTSDVGKAWWIDNLVYVWTGDHYEAKAMGSPGQPGPTPQITVTTEVIPPDQTSTVEQSGTSLNKHRGTHPQGHRQLKHALYFPAMVAGKHNPAIAAFWQRLKAQNKPGLVIVVACMHKLLAIVYGVLKSKTPFQASRFEPPTA